MNERRIPQALYADTTYLLTEIIGVISKKSVQKIFDYTKLLEDVFLLHTNCEACLLKREGENNVEDATVSMYLNSLSSKSIALENELQKQFDELSELLGSNAWLLEDFTETYRLVRGLVKDNIYELTPLRLVAS